MRRFGGKDFEAFGYSPCAVSGLGVNGRFIDCSGSHEGGINVCYSKVRKSANSRVYLAKTLN